MSISPKDGVVEGKKAVLTCESDANPPTSHYAWFDWNNQDLRHYDQTLRLDPVTLQHSGTYWCQGTNRLGRGQSSPTTLTVYCKGPSPALATPAACVPDLLPAPARRVGSGQPVRSEAPLLHTQLPCLPSSPISLSPPQEDSGCPYLPDILSSSWLPLSASPLIGCLFLPFEIVVVLGFFLKTIQVQGKNSMKG